MGNWIKERNNQIVLAIVLLMCALIIRLFLLTVIEGKNWGDTATNLSIKNIYTSAPRGEIRDRYGRVLAGNKPSFNVRISKGNLDDQQLNAVAYNLIKIFEKNGDTYYDDFPIIIEGSNYYFSYQKSIQDWLITQGIPANFTAQETFEELKRREGIPEATDKYEAQTKLQTVSNIYPPISVKNMKYLEDLNQDKFLGRYNLATTTSAIEAFQKLKEKFEIDPALPDVEARKIMIIRNEISAQGFRSYMPANVAQGISEQTIVDVEEKGDLLPGVEVVPESVRDYPNITTASHLLGYLGHISESQKDQYVELGYNANDMIGKTGLEGVYESTLKGTNGSKNVEVNALGELTRVINETPPEKGKDVYLTIDLELQKTAEAALKQSLEKLQSGGTFQSEYGNYSYKAYPNANVGAVVAIDTQTGDVLAMGSYPDYDPNLFTSGISTENWNALQPQNPRDQLAPRPLYNVAAMTAVQPGSIFKMVTATAALDSGMSPTKQLRDDGVIKLGNRTYGCVVWNLHPGRTHSYLNFYRALEVSCNYYFYDIITNKDWANGEKSLGMDSSMGMQKVLDFAQEYGLGMPTGIEIDETVLPVPSKERKMKSMKALLKNDLIVNAERYFDEETIADKTLLMKNIDTIVSWMEENPKTSVVKNRMKSLGIKKNMLDTVANKCRSDYFNQATWSTGDAFNISIGQGENAYTPLQMTNYVATIANGGTLNQVSVVSGIEGQGALVKPAGKPLSVKDFGILDTIKKAMAQVARGAEGGARRAFSGFPVEVGVKTGTAQRSGKVPAVDEVEYIRTHLSAIAPGISFADVETEMNRLLTDYADIYGSDKNKAVRSALINLSGGKLTAERIDYAKAEYEDFAWFVSFAPLDNPRIAVAVLLFQGGTGANAAPIAREIIGKYLGIGATYTDYSLDTSITQ